MEEYNFQFMKYVINRTVPFSKVLSYLDMNSEYGTIFCPFHENVNTPAARLYRDEDGDTIYCFSEQKLYRPADAITKGLIDTKIDRVFDRVWSKLSDAIKKGLMLEFEKPTYKEDDATSLINQELGGFKTGEFDYNNFKAKLINIHKKCKNSPEASNNSTHNSSYNSHYNDDDEKRTDRTTSQVNTDRSRTTGPSQ